MGQGQQKGRGMAGPGGTGPAGAPGEVAVPLTAAAVTVLPASWSLLRDWATWYAPQRETPLRWLETHTTQQLTVVQLSLIHI